ncbi:hypothetical protein OE88DRAFT_1656357 [Heliocybe sulcata]|uniref:Large ribosomal subunit protein bL28c n=1 Tax=Heliocybe sulcata TaxID=5364 RepID=A0A5C3N4R2_9AGAM|nr:hypothetical protein OE88DRAFT_1656357 [Heliocybe sulcata]
MLPSLLVLSSFPTQAFKRSQEGLFHGKTKLTGYSIPFSKHKTKRTWLPNIQSKRIFSDALGKTLKLKVTTKAMKTMKKYGTDGKMDLDRYLLRTKSDKLGQQGMRLRLRVEEALEKKRQKTLAGAAAAPVPAPRVAARPAL